MSAPSDSAAPAGPVVRFAFDETTIGPVATGVLRQAAADALNARPVNLSIRGTADDGDTDHERQLGGRPRSRSSSSAWA